MVVVICRDRVAVDNLGMGAPRDEHRGLGMARAVELHRFANRQLICSPDLDLGTSP